MKPAHKAFTAGFGTMLQLLSSSTSNAQTTIAVRATNGQSDQLALALKAIASPDRVVIPAHTDPYQVFRVHCGGSVTQTYVELVREANRGIVSPLAPSAMDRPFQLPACPRVERNVQVEVQPGDTIEKLLLREMGALPDENIQDCTPAGCQIMTARSSVARRNGAERAGLNDLKPGRELWLPYVAHWTEVQVNSGVSSELAAHTVEQAGRPVLGRSLTPPVPAAGALSAPTAINSRDLRLVTPLGTENLKGTICDPALGSPPSWPYDARSLQARLDSVEQEAAKAHPGMQFLKVVRIIDAGFEGLGSLIPTNALTPNAKLQEGQILDENDVGKYGIAPRALHGDLSPVQTYQYHWHGAEVAALALGGQEFVATATTNLVRLTFANAFVASGSSDIKPDDYILGKSFTAAPPIADIMNASIGDASKPTSFDDQIKRNVGTLVVVAAGNQGAALTGGGTSSFPAMSGDASIPNLIVVGAYAPNGVIAPFSNHSAEHVDLLAPGCRIKAKDSSGNTIDLDGTSFAAPLVSFTAALVEALDPDITTPAQVKERLMLTVDYDPTLKYDVRSSGRLNIQRAIQLYDDILTTTDGRDIPGSWVTSGSLSLSDMCVSNPSFRDSYKVAALQLRPGTGGTARMLRIVYNVPGGASGQTDSEECEANDAGYLNFAQSGKDAEPIEISRVRGLVTRVSTVPK